MLNKNTPGVKKARPSQKQELALSGQGPTFLQATV